MQDSENNPPNLLRDSDMYRHEEDTAFARTQQRNRPK
jgi:hypothetical protein